MRNPETFTALNGLRFFAALFVVILHYAPRTEAYAQVPVVIKNLINEGPAAVGFFFVLSGFVLAYRHLQNSSKVQTAAEFYWARFSRLYPAYVFAFLLFLPMAVHLYFSNTPLTGGRHIFIASAVLSCLMVQAWTPLAQAWNGPSWSLSVEAFMYLMFPLIGARLLRLSRRNTIFVLLASWLIPSAFASAYEWRWISGAVWREYITNNPLLWMPLFMMGICATRALSAWRNMREATASNISAIVLTAVILISVLWPHSWGNVFVTGGIAPLLVALIVCFTRRSGWITRFIGAPFFNRLGEVSYGVYILQAPVWHYWQEFTNYERGIPIGTDIVATWQMVVFIPVLILVSFATQNFIENPMRSWLATLRDTRFKETERPRPASLECQATMNQQIGL